MRGQHHDEARTDAGHRCGQGLAAVGVGGTQDKQTILFGAHRPCQSVNAVHGVAADALAHDPGGVIDALAPRQFDGVAEFLDPLIDERKHLVQQLAF